MIKELTTEQYEYLISKVNELVHSIDQAKIELKGNSQAINKILSMEKILMQLEQRISNNLRKH